MTPILYAKIGGALVFVALLFGAGYHVRGLRDTAASEALHAAQMSAIATAYQNQVIAREASEAQLQKVQNAYDAIKDVPDPVSTGLAQRVLLAAGSACRSDVPKAGAVAGGAQAPAALPGGPASVGGRLQDLIDACRNDAEQMKAMIELAP